MRLRILGGLNLTSAADAPAPDLARQSRLLLACLALAGTKGLTRAELCALFWPDRPSALARNSLRQGLAAIRKALRNDAGAISIQSDLEIVKLTAGAEAIDVRIFCQGLHEGGRDGLIAAAGAFGGELLAGLEIPEEVEQFVMSHRRSLNDQARELAERLSKVDDADNESLNAAQALAERLLQSDPASEEAHRALMRTHLRRGRTNAALRQFEQCKEALRRELRAEPDAQTRRLCHSIQSSESDEGTQLADRPAAATGAGPYPSIAIMPFDNLGEASDAYFADGVAEEIASTLSRIRDFFVIARQSTLTFKGRFVDAREVGRTLRVAYLVEGTARRDGDRLRISVQLVDAVTLTQLWSDRYEGANTEIFAFQDRIAAQVAGALNPVIRRAEIEAARRKPPTSLRAYDQVMRAFPKLWGQNASVIHEAITILQDALRIDPTYGRARALLAWCHALNATYLWTAEPEREGRSRATRGRRHDGPDRRRPDRIDCGRRRGWPVWRSGGCIRLARPGART